MNKHIFGVSLKSIIKFIIVYTIFAITAYITKFYIESVFYTIIISTISAFVMLLIAIPKKEFKKLFQIVESNK